MTMKRVRPKYPASAVVYIADGVAENLEEYMKGPKFGHLRYECPRCGDSFDCATENDVFLATTHRLLHLSGDWRQSLRPAAYWSFEDERSSTPTAS